MISLKRIIGHPSSSPFFSALLGHKKLTNAQKKRALFERIVDEEIMRRDYENEKASEMNEEDVLQDDVEKSEPSEGSTNEPSILNSF